MLQQGISCGTLSEIMFRNMLLTVGQKIAFYSNVAALVCECSANECTDEIRVHCTTSKYKYDRISAYDEYLVSRFNANRIVKQGWNVSSEVGWRRIRGFHILLEHYRANHKWLAPQCVRQVNPNQCTEWKYVGNVHEEENLRPHWGPSMNAAPPSLDSHIEEG
jgi:hypothetical protein